MELKECIQDIVDYIESHIQDELTADSISEKAGYSKFYLHRIFSIYTGVTLMDYVRKRKLHRSLDALNSNQRIIDVALDYGFNSERSYSRAFVKEFGQSPSQLRHTDVCVCSKIIVYNLNLPSEGGLREMNGYLSKIKYETLKAMTVISGKRVGLEPEDEIIGIMTKWSNDNNIRVERQFGFDIPISEEEKAKGYRGYEYWLKVKGPLNSQAIVNDEFEWKEIPGYKYVSLRITDPFLDPFERIPNGWKTLVAWLEENQVSSNFDQSENAYCLEEVIEIEGRTYMDIYIPILSV